MLKTIGSIGSATNLKETEGKVGSDSMIGNMVDDDEATNPTKKKLGKNN